MKNKIPYIANLATNTTPDAKVTTGYLALLTQLLLPFLLLLRMKYLILVVLQ